MTIGALHLFSTGQPEGASRGQSHSTPPVSSLVANALLASHPSRDQDGNPLPGLGGQVHLALPTSPAASHWLPASSHPAPWPFKQEVLLPTMGTSHKGPIFLEGALSSINSFTFTSYLSGQGRCL